MYPYLYRGLVSSVSSVTVFFTSSASVVLYAMVTLLTCSKVTSTGSFIAFSRRPAGRLCVSGGFLVLLNSGPMRLGSLYVRECFISTLVFSTACTARVYRYV